MKLTVDSGKFPEGRVEKQLSNLIEISHGYAFKGSDFEESDDITKPIVLTPGNYSENGELYFATQNTKRLIGNALPDGYMFDVGELTVVMTDLSSKMKILGKPAFINQPNILHNQRIGRIHFKDESLVPQFLYYFFRTRFFTNKIKETATGTMVRHTAPNRILANKIFLPPIAEQKRIVAILDEAFEGIDRVIADTEKNLANSRELFESYLNNIFTQKGDGWEDKTLKQISIQFGRGKSKHRRRNDKKLYGGKYPFIQTGDIRNSNHIITDYSQTYNEVGLAQSKLWRKGTVCITIAANIAETGVLNFEACIPDSVIGLVVDPNKANNMFVEYMLQAFKFFLKSKGKGSAQDNINMKTFESQTFPFPLIDEQERITLKLDFLSTETQRLETIYHKKIAALRELKQSILQKAFTGELTADTNKITEEEIAA